MEDAKRSDFVGRHLIIDASTTNRRNLTSTDTVFTLLEALARNLDMTLVLPPIVFRYPFANSELATFCDDIEIELKAKSEGHGREQRPGRPEPGAGPCHAGVPEKRQMEDSGVTGMSIWAESHAAFTRGTRTTTTRSTPSAARISGRRTRSGSCCRTSNGRPQLRQPDAIPALAAAGVELPGQRKLGSARQRRCHRRARRGQFRRDLIRFHVSPTASRPGEIAAASARAFPRSRSACQAVAGPAPRGLSFLTSLTGVNGSPPALGPSRRT